MEFHGTILILVSNVSPCCNIIRALTHYLKDPDGLAGTFGNCKLSE